MDPGEGEGGPLATGNSGMSGNLALLKTHASMTASRVASYIRHMNVIRTPNEAPEIAG